MTSLGSQDMYGQAAQYRVPRAREKENRNCSCNLPLMLLLLLNWIQFHMVPDVLVIVRDCSWGVGKVL
jgi:hypothetical protein